MLGIFWPDETSNEDLPVRTGMGNIEKDHPSTTQAMAWACLPCAIQLSSQNRTAEDTSGEEKSRATERDMEKDLQEIFEEQRSGPPLGPRAAADRARWRSLAV